MPDPQTRFRKPESGNGNGVSWKLLAIVAWGLLAGIASWNLRETIALGKEVVRVETKLDMTPLTVNSMTPLQREKLLREVDAEILIKTNAVIAAAMK